MRNELYAALTILGVCAGIAAPAAFAQTPLAAPTLERPLVVKAPVLPAIEQVAPKPVAALVANADIKSRLLSGREEIALNGRISAYLRVPDPARQPNVLEVQALNVVYFGVPQESITGFKPREKATGALGFAADPGKRQYLKYDPKAGVVYGEVAGRIDLPQFAELAPPLGDEKGDDFRTRTQRATLRVQFTMQQADSLYVQRAPVEKRAAAMDVEVIAQPEADLRVSDYRIATERFVVDFEYGWFPVIEVAKRLCVQPVRVGSITFQGWPPVFQFHFSGDGLAFGKPGAIAQWAKADVVFEWRDWMTVWNASYLTLNSGESAGLRGEVSVDDCVEVFFVDQLSPNSMWGGGATWGSGTAAAKIISSDQNADFGIDHTHLAHELGHAMALMHPGSGTADDGSTGTLMCPSGFMNDNPQVNSQENKDKISNPLFTFAIKLVSAGPDCTNSATCGACP
jgi:hypothetical protein